MNMLKKSESIKAGLRQGFQDGSSKMVKRKCYGYTVSPDASQIENDGLMDRYLYTDSHETIISDEMYMAVQQEEITRTKDPEKTVP